MSSRIEPLKPGESDDAEVNRILNDAVEGWFNDSAMFGLIGRQPALLKTIVPVFEAFFLGGRIEAHIFVAFVAYCLMVTLKHRLRALAPGLTPRTVLEKLSAMQMVDVHLPTTDGRHIVLPRYTQPEKDQRLLLQRYCHVN